MKNLVHLRINEKSIAVIKTENDLKRLIKHKDLNAKPGIGFGRIEYTGFYTDKKFVERINKLIDEFIRMATKRQFNHVNHESLEKIKG